MAETQVQNGERIALAVVAELTYLLLSRVLLPKLLGEVQLELATTALRLATALLYWSLFRQLISSRVVVQRVPGGLLCLGAAMLILLAAWLVADQHFSSSTTRIVFAVTSIAVGLREEFLYRGIIQNALERRIGLPLALMVSNALFVVYHWGALQLNVASVVEIFCVGSILGALYVATGSIWKVIALHAAYDAIFAMSPMQAPLNKWVGDGLLMFALALMIGWIVAFSRKERAG